ncbi:MAG TPA: chloride channel protein [Verrucomicrobiae bacterium]|nr:chloride channel protein [Verrucomicrobiae bacterium]
MIALFARYVNSLRRHYQTRLMLLSVLVGIIVAAGALLFTRIIDFAAAFFMTRLVGYAMPLPGAEGLTVMPGEPTHRWLLFVVPAVGGLLAGLTIYWLAPDAAGHGTDSVIDAFHRKRGQMSRRIPLVKTIATAFTLGTGGSAGREGPIMQVGAGLATILGRIFKSGDRERRLLILAGAGAGLGAIFRSPLGGALFASEVLYRDVDFETPALVPSFVASITAYSIYCGTMGTWGAIFTEPLLTFQHVFELPFYILLGLLCALVGIVYLYTMHRVEGLFHRLRTPSYIKPALGGLVVGAIGYFVPQVLGQGYGWVQLAIAGDLSLGIVLAVAFVKIVSTSFTIGSGGSGGTFAPTVVIGGMLGTAVGLVLRQFWPGITPSMPAFALVGMAGFLAGTAKTPLSALIMVSEMTMGYGLLVPLMLATAAAYVLSPRNLTLYRSQVGQRVDSPAHEGEYVNAALERIHVKEALPKDQRVLTFHRETPLPEILEEVSQSTQLIFPVVDDGGSLQGVIEFPSIRVFYSKNCAPSDALIAQDLLAPAFAVVKLDDDLGAVLRKFRTARLEELPVVESENSTRLVGVLNRRDVLAAYHDRLV